MGNVATVIIICMLYIQFSHFLLCLNRFTGWFEDGSICYTLDRYITHMVRWILFVTDRSSWYLNQPEFGDCYNVYGIYGNCIV